MESYSELMDKYYALLENNGFSRNFQDWGKVCDKCVDLACEIKHALVVAEEAAFRDWTGHLTIGQEERWAEAYFATTGGVVSGPFDDWELAIDDAFERSPHKTPAVYVGKIHPEFIPSYDILDSDLGALGL